MNDIASFFGAGLGSAGPIAVFLYYTYRDIQQIKKRLWRLEGWIYEKGWGSAEGEGD